MLKPGEVLEGEVLEAKKEEKTAVIKFGQRPIEARVTAELKTGQQVKVEVRGWYNGELVLKVLSSDGNSLADGSLDVKA